MFYSKYQSGNGKQHLMKQMNCMNKITNKAGDRTYENISTLKELEYDNSKYQANHKNIKIA